MGTILSRTCLASRTLFIRLILRIWRIFSPPLDALLKRLTLSPGIPVPKPSTPYWAIPPSPIARHGSEPDSTLPEFADVVIIGSGITGTAFARTFLDHDAQYGVKDRPLKVVMLEARDACSGATARNGGHITPLLYHDYSRFKKSHGRSTAKQIIRFRLAHLPQFLEVATQENLLQDSQCREVETFDVFHDKGLYSNAKNLLGVYRKDMPVESATYREYEGAEAIKKLHLSPRTVGALSTRAGAIHPYRFVTGILSRLLQSYPSHFHLFTQTPCTAISSPMSLNIYTITTPKGTMQTPHIIHATNAWTSHLLPSMRDKIIPVRANMTAQTPWKLLNAVKTSDENCWTGARSFVFYPAATDAALDYLTQQPPTPSLAHSISLPTSSLSVYPPSAAELMFGGGLTQGGHDDGAYIEQVGNVDDGTWTPAVTNYLRRALAGYFADCGCCVGNEQTPKGGMEGGGDDVRVKAEWSGIVGESVDAMPWVGRVPEKVSGRRAPVRSRKRGEMGGNVDGVDGDIRVVEGLGMPLLDTPTPEPLSPIRLAPPGEWIAAGYSGEGMVHAWMSGKALAFMVLGLDRNPISSISTVRHHTGEQGEGRGDGLGEWFPDVFRVSEERWKQATIEDLFASRIE